jgi:hypothetical protein
MNQLKGFDSVFDTTINNQLLDNIVDFFDFGLLQKGNYFNVDIRETDSNNKDYSKLNYIDLNYIEGLVFEGFRTNWVWQNNIPYIPPPNIANELFIDGELSTKNTIGREYKIDFYNGRIIFNNQDSSVSNRVTKNSIIQLAYSYKYIHVIYADALPWIQEIKSKTLYDLNSSDNKFHINEMKVQLPTIAIEIVPNKSMEGYQLGGGQYIQTDVIVHCISENNIELNKLVDIVSFQNDKTIKMFDSNKIKKSNAYPINYDGTIKSNPLTFKDLVEQFPSYSFRLTNASTQKSQTINSNLNIATVKFNAEIINDYI